MDIPTFGTKLPGRPYQTRPGAYAVIQNTDGQIAMVKTKGGKYSFLPGGGIELEEAYAYNLSPRDRREIKKIIFEHFEYIEEQWDEFERRRQS